MARFEKDFVRSDEAQLSLNELLDLLAVAGDGSGQSREDAIACYLSGSEGWRDAVKSLGGAFAEGESGLKERKAD